MSDAGSIEVFRRLESYSWDSDEEFKSGLASILDSHSSSDEVETLTLQARCFYFSRKFQVPVDFASYRSWRLCRNGEISQSPKRYQHSAEAQSTSSDPAAPYPTSFAHIVELITEGKPIPGIQNIPNTVLEGSGLPSVKPKRKKPWERAEAPEESQENQIIMH